MTWTQAYPGNMMDFIAILWLFSRHRHPLGDRCPLKTMGPFSCKEASHNALWCCRKSKHFHDICYNSLWLPVHSTHRTQVPLKICSPNTHMLDTRVSLSLLPNFFCPMFTLCRIFAESKFITQGHLFYWFNQLPLTQRCTFCWGFSLQYNVQSVLTCNSHGINSLSKVCT